MLNGVEEKHGSKEMDICLIIRLSVLMVSSSVFFLEGCTPLKQKQRNESIDIQTNGEEKTKTEDGGIKHLSPVADEGGAALQIKH